MESRKNGFLPGKIVIVVTILSFLIFTQIGVAKGHSPSIMSLNYDNANNELTVQFNHSVQDANEHYVERVEIQKNGTVLDESYTNQPTTNTFSYTYEVSATEGDTITASAYCNKFGDVSETLDVGDGDGNGGNGTPWGVIGGGIAIFIAIGIALILYMRRES